MRPSLVLLLLVALPACTPYAVATTARPLAVGESRKTAMYYFVPGGLEANDSTKFSWPGFDAEWRWGVNERADMGVRVNAASGLIATYKRRLDAPSNAAGRATALILGGGFVNMGQHAHVEATLLTSGDERGGTVPYGGIKVMQVAPMSSSAVRDTPAIGAFGGARIGAGRMLLSLELGAFYDRSALGMRRGDFIVVPSISLHRGH